MVIIMTNKSQQLNFYLVANVLLQIRRSHKVLSPNVCITCLRDEETHSHLFLHCPVAREMLSRLLALSGACWLAPKQVDDFLMIGWLGFGNSKDKKVFMEVCSFLYDLMYLARARC